MGKLNVNKSGCNTTNSNCVIWGGPDLDCIGVCKGDSITEVVYEIATKLCNLLDDMDVTTYDLGCLTPDNCPPQTWKDLAELLAQAICELQGRECPECEDGANGNYIDTAYEPAGSNCPGGGVVITTFNGETNQPIKISYVCNGAAGTPGTPGTVGPAGVQGATGNNGRSGRGIAVFSQADQPNQSDFDSQYGNAEGFGVNFIAGNNQIKPGDIWIQPCN